MTDLTSDYLALHRDVAAVRTDREVIRASGPDTQTFLQGQLSQDVTGLAPGESRWALLLEPQGRVDAWVRIWGGVDGDVLIDVDGGAAELVLARLRRFLLRVDTTFELLDWRSVALRGPNCPAIGDLSGCAELAGAVRWCGVDGVDLLGPAVAVPDGIAEADPMALDTLRIEAGWPANGAELGDVDPKVIPAEAGEWLVELSASFTKGCYTGQELVARVDSRGSNTPRKLRGVVLGENVIPPTGAEIVVDDTVRGSLTSVGESLDLRAPVALGYVHRSVEPSTEVRLRWDGGDASAQVRELPLLRP